jgi:hypothetical protein
LKGPGAIARSGFADASWYAARSSSNRPPSLRIELAARDLRERKSAGAPEIRESALLLVILTVLPPKHDFQLKEVDVSALATAETSPIWPDKNPQDKTIVVETSPSRKV